MDRPLWIQVVEGQVKEVWDTYPPGEANTWAANGWREAVEVHPDLIPNREMETPHTFDLESVPARIVWGKREITFEERRDSMKSGAIGQFQFFVQRQVQSLQNGGTYDDAAIAAEKTVMDAKVAALDAASTHEDLDAIQ